MSSSKPIILDPKNPSDQQKLENLKSQSSTQVLDDYNVQLEELTEILQMQKGTVNEEDLDEEKWVYFPWNGNLIRILSSKNFKLVRTSRNQNLIPEEEQVKFSGKRIAIAGLNVGNPAALCMVLEGVLTSAKYADHDHLSLSNLNRFRARLSDLGLNKAILSAQQSFEIDPYLDIEVLEKGILPGGESDFLLSPRVDVLVEEMDNLPLKISIREEAKRNRIPVVMVTGNGANVIIDVERYDIEPDLEILNGYLEQSIIDIAKGPKLQTLKPQERVHLARDFMGERYLTKRLRDSFKEVGTGLAGIPQLAESSFLRGAAVSYVVRSILTGTELGSGRYFLELEQILETKGKYEKSI